MFRRAAIDRGQHVAGGGQIFERQHQQAAHIGPRIPLRTPPVADYRAAATIGAIGSTSVRARSSQRGDQAADHRDQPGAAESRGAGGELHRAHQQRQISRTRAAQPAHQNASALPYEHAEQRRHTEPRRPRGGAEQLAGGGPISRRLDRASVAAATRSGSVVPCEVQCPWTNGPETERASLREQVRQRA